MTLRNNLKTRLVEDYLKSPKKYFNGNNLEMTWDEKENLYIGIDIKGEEWIAGSQNTSVAIFGVNCTNNNDCNALNIVAICYDGEKITCRKCKKDFIAHLVISKSSRAYDILEKLDK